MPDADNQSGLDRLAGDYVGDLSDGKRDGRGECRWRDGRRYVGMWRNNLRHGLGVLTWDDGQKYDGEWQDDLATGKATLSKPDGSVYSGAFLDSRRHGLGTQTYPNGATFAGEWKDDHPDGWGTIGTIDGRQIKGRLEINRRHGRGVQFFADGENDDNNRVYWEEGEFIPQFEWFARENRQIFAEEARRLGLPFSECEGISNEEKIYILDDLSGNCLVELNGMALLVIQASVYFLQHNARGDRGDICSPGGLSKVLALDHEGIAAYCREKNLPDANRERLERWVEWSKSEEKSALEADLKNRLSEAET